MLIGVGKVESRQVEGVRVVVIVFGFQIVRTKSTECAAQVERFEVLQGFSGQWRQSRIVVRSVNAEVLCRSDRLDLMVETLKIGAMNVNSALKYFRKGRNMAVVTGGDRADIQMAALETSTHCLILTGQLPPQPFILSRAEELEIPVLSVDLDTLTTVEIVDDAFGQVRLHEPIKVQCIRQMMDRHFDIERLMSQLGLEPAVPAH